MIRIARRWPMIFGLFALAVISGEDALSAELQGAQRLGAAIADLTETFPEAYSAGNAYLDRLHRLEAAAENADPEAAKSIQADLEALRREALIANPLVSGQPILFVIRRQYRSDHHSTATLFQTGEVNTQSFDGGGAMKTVDLGRGGVVSTWIDLPEGVVRDPDVRFDGEKVVFSMRRNIEDDYHIYEINADGTGLVQLTFGSGLSDVDPIYLPDGRICFASTRDLKYCQCFRNAMVNLFVMETDGANVHQIGRNDLSEAHPSLAPDGRILYGRWEYVDRHYGPSFGIWTMCPDGSRQSLYYGNNAWSPGAIHDARILPGAQQFIGVLGACHDRPWGALAIVDRRRGLDGTEPLVRTWPGDISQRIDDQKVFRAGNDVYQAEAESMTPGAHPSVWQIDLLKGLSPKYEDPYPLSSKYFLCSRTIGEGEKTALFLLDVFGNELLLHQEGPGCFDPMPLGPRLRPPTIQSRVDLAENVGHFFVADVYRGSGMEDVPRGTVKTLRVVEAPPKRYWTVEAWGYDSQVSPAMNFNSTINKRILGDAPVESDGSAYFEVPADKFLFFQALDADGMMIQSMRSGTTVRPGAVVGCVGCHENRQTAPPPGLDSCAIASRRPPSKLRPWYGPPREFNYLTEVQPVFDRRCVRCHDYGQEAGEVLNLAGDLGLVFNTSYLDIRRRSSLRWFPEPRDAAKRLLKVVDDGPPEVLPPYAWGSHRSKLADVVRGEHYDVKLSREEIDRVITWIDINAPYYGSYASAYRENHFGRSPLGSGELARLVQLTGVPLNAGRMGAELRGSQVNFTRPELSPCLSGFGDRNDPNYTEALAIIRAGTERLAERPRADMPGFQPRCWPDLIRLAKGRLQQAIESDMRDAIVKRDRRYDKEIRERLEEVIEPKPPAGAVRYVDMTNALGSVSLVDGQLLIDHTATSGGPKTVAVDRNFEELIGKRYSISCRFVFNTSSNPRSWCCIRLDDQKTNEVVGGDVEFLARRTGWWRVYCHGKEVAGDEVSLQAAESYHVQLILDETTSKKTYSVVVDGVSLVRAAPFEPSNPDRRYVALKHYGYGPADGYRFDDLAVAPGPPSAGVRDRGGLFDSFDTEARYAGVNDELGPPRQPEARPPLIAK